MAIQPRNTADIKVDTISEKTTSLGVTVEGVKAANGGIRLANNTYLKARNAANDADLNILKLNASNILEFASGLLADTPIEIGTWSPTYSTFGGTSFTFTSVTTSFAKYWKIGKLVFFSIRALGTTAGSVAGSSLKFTLPFSGATSDQELPATTFELGGFGKPGRCNISSSEASVTLGAGGTAWSLGAVTGFGVNGFYFIS